LPVPISLLFGVGGGRSLLQNPARHSPTTLASTAATERQAIWGKCFAGAEQALAYVLLDVPANWASTVVYQQAESDINRRQYAES
jgi:hypothetical protein